MLAFVFKDDMHFMTLKLKVSVPVEYSLFCVRKMYSSCRQISVGIARTHEWVQVVIEAFGD